MLMVRLPIYAAPSNLVMDYVEVSRLSASQKSKWRSVAEEELESDEEYPQENWTALWAK